MFLRTLSIVLYIFRLCASDSTYECGVHGKFEYCIDGVPGCVIGCHCHPGYYFDTDTKICEPNIKLTQDYRRHYHSAEPTRVHLEPMITLPANDIVLERTTKSLIDQKVDDIAKDADDLGDWLYNQFFKTIENQVINKTNGENLQTRRSGGDKKPVRRSHKKHYRKPKRGKKKNFKNKLLRITEDDSLFDSSSTETDTDDDSTSDSSSSSTSGESEDTSRSSKKKKKKGHGHKKIVIFNKKPRPPLPSFIFLPNMDTPFFPPIGLPPPGVPMYPMVPVPPVMGPMFPFPGIVDNGGNLSNGNNNGNNNLNGNNGNGNNGNGNNGNPTTTANNGNSATSAPTVSYAPSDDTTTVGPAGTTEPGADPEADPTADPEVPKDPTRILRQRRIKRPLRTRPEINDNQHPRNKLLQKLRQKMIRKNKLENFIAEQYQDGTQLMDLPPNFESGSDQMKLIEKPPASHPDVDFKYLTELIHRMDPNDTSRNNLANLVAATEMPLPNRRYSNPNQQYTFYQNAQNNTRRQSHKADDSYYSNLGRQIASMIKNIDLTGDRKIDVEIERQINQETPIQHVFNENGGYGSRSYWERSVRSPLKYVSEFKKAPNYSNEHLFKLENQVEFAASTERILTLQELERIISGMKKTQQQPSYKPQINYTKLNEPLRSPSKISFNLNVLSKNENIYKKPKTIPTTKLPMVWRKPNKKEVIVSGLDNFLINNYQRPLPKKENVILKKKSTSISVENNPIHTLIMKPTRQPNRLPVTKKPKKIWYQPKYLVNLNPSPKTENINHQEYNLSPLTPILLKHYSPDFNPNNKKQYLLEKQTIPVHLQHFVSKKLNPYVAVVKKTKPSYFYHEFHHLDYFDKK